MSDPVDIDGLAASLRADAGDVDAFFDVLASKLADAFPSAVELERGGFLGRGGVKRVGVTLGERVYEAERERGRVECRARSVVRGIALKSETLALDAWLDALASDLATEAQSSERARVALEELLTR